MQSLYANPLTEAVLAVTLPEAVVMAGDGRQWVKVRAIFLTLIKLSLQQHVALQVMSSICVSSASPTEKKHSDVGGKNLLQRSQSLQLKISQSSAEVPDIPITFPCLVLRRSF